MARVVKITISLPEELVLMADRLAREAATTRSGVFADLLRRKAEGELTALMAEGYQAMAEENLREAEEWLPLTREVVLRDG